jgi:hypothetical protein
MAVSWAMVRALAKFLVLRTGYRIFDELHELLWRLSAELVGCVR